jgi:methyltransferase (TIGR00027 family)
MEPGRPSRTAEFMALFRALETCRRPAAARLFEDPLATGFLGPGLGLVAGAARLPPLGRFLASAIDRRWPGARSSGIARTRLIDDAVRRALAQGAEQLVLLGAGFDSRAYRLPGIEATRVFEVDHPATLGRKRTRLLRRLGRLPGHVALVPLDFGREDLTPALRAAGFRSGARSFFVWEGVTNYLSAAAVDQTLRFVGGAAPGSGLVFTYVHRDVVAGSWSGEGLGPLSDTLRRAGEAWTFGIDPAALRGLLAARGLELLEDVGSVEYRARYLGAGAHLRGYEFYRAAVATVPLAAREAVGAQG